MFLVFFLCCQKSGGGGVPDPVSVYGSIQKKRREFLLMCFSLIWKQIFSRRFQEILTDSGPISQNWTIWLSLNHWLANKNRIATSEWQHTKSLLGSNRLFYLSTWLHLQSWWKEACGRWQVFVTPTICERCGHIGCLKILWQLGKSTELEVWILCPFYMTFCINCWSCDHILMNLTTLPLIHGAWFFLHTLSSQ